MVCTLNGKRHQAAILYKIHDAVEKFFKVVPHAEELKPYGL